MLFLLVDNIFVTKVANLPHTPISMWLQAWFPRRDPHLPFSQRMELPITSLLSSPNRPHGPVPTVPLPGKPCCLSQLLTSPCHQLTMAFLEIVPAPSSFFPFFPQHLRCCTIQHNFFLSFSSHLAYRLFPSTRNTVPSGQGPTHPCREEVPGSRWGAHRQKHTHWQGKLTDTGPR